MAVEQVLAPIQPNALLTDEVVVRLRQAIIEGKLGPGQHLAENTIAQQLSVSRSPVRDALRILEREGLVISLPNRGCFVREFSPQDVAEIFSLRAAIESVAAEWAVGRLDERDYQEMEHLLELQQQAVADGDMACLNAVDINFHDYICRRAGHSRALEVWEGIRNQCLVLFRRRLRAYPDYVPQTVISDHRRFLEAFRARDLPQVLALHREVNQRIVQEVRDALAGGSDEQSARQG